MSSRIATKLKNFRSYRAALDDGGEISGDQAEVAAAMRSKAAWAWWNSRRHGDAVFAPTPITNSWWAAIRGASDNHKDYTVADREEERPIVAG